CLGHDDASASALLGLPSGGLDYMVAGVRETFEEVGLLLAVAEHGEPIEPAAMPPWRAKLQAGDCGIAEMCRACGLLLDMRGLRYFSHWLTPPGSPKRFDTRFFAVAAPAGQIAEADGAEAQSLVWLTPGAALDRASGLKLLAVTRETLSDLQRHPDATSALDASAERAAAQGGIGLTMPHRALGSRGPRVVLPHEFPYAEVARLDPEGRGDVWAEIVAGNAVRLSSRIVRVTAPNPGPMTGPGTNSYLVAGSSGGDWTVIDPGPESEPHLQALLAAVSNASGGEGRIAQILVTHTHRDHSPGAAALSAATGAPVLGQRAAHPMWQDDGFSPQREPQHGERLPLAADTTLRVVHTPGHASNHLCYLLEEEQTLFTGDHVMQGSTVVINPPDGDMTAYLKSLHDLLGLELQWLAPGHGFLVAEPKRVLRALIAHRLRREAKVLATLQRASAGGPVTPEALLPRVYDDVPAVLHPVALRSLLAHLLKLRDDGAAQESGGRWTACT
ncbi:MAG: MBL fold metallo-hydrolase, partial [Pseudomonadota bacterium]|nr:MBL fold metallo-hydrolase [Pseudomonadota bacterium]